MIRASSEEELLDSSHCTYTYSADIACRLSMSTGMEQIAPFDETTAERCTALSTE